MWDAYPVPAIGRDSGAAASGQQLLIARLIATPAGSADAGASATIRGAAATVFTWVTVAAGWVIAALVPTPSLCADAGVAASASAAAAGGSGSATATILTRRIVTASWMAAIFE
jgi:hypothetical protein